MIKKKKQEKDKPTFTYHNKTPFQQYNLTTTKNEETNQTHQAIYWELPIYILCNSKTKQIQT